MSDDQPFGPDRDDPPGLTPLPGHAMPPQLTDFHVESCALHSQSRGWLPAITVRARAGDGVSVTFVMVADHNVTEIANSLQAAAKRARLDLREATKRGQLP